MRVKNESVENAGEDCILDAVREAVGAGCGEVWIEGVEEAMLGVVVGGGRVMVLWLAGVGDVGYHAVDLVASTEASEEYVLANGQVDRYADCDTVEVRHIGAVVRDFLATAGRWPGVEWQDDGAD